MIFGDVTFFTGQRAQDSHRLAYATTRGEAEHQLKPGFPFEQRYIQVVARLLLRGLRRIAPVVNH